jgi:hypothetical protein
MSIALYENFEADGAVPDWPGTGPVKSGFFGLAVVFGTLSDEQYTETFEAQYWRYFSGADLVFGVDSDSYDTFDAPYWAAFHGSYGPFGINSDLYETFDAQYWRYFSGAYVVFGTSAVAYETFEDLEWTTYVLFSDSGSPKYESFEEVAIDWQHSGWTGVAPTMATMYWYDVYFDGSYYYERFASGYW